jgi:imidazoleglycerol phosphate synthase glutamine amidotransferase subunit HisH
VYGERFCAAAGAERVTGVQFHPEKSSSAGLGLLGRWLAELEVPAPA